jgi:hypothetical protein
MHSSPLSTTAVGHVAIAAAPGPPGSPIGVQALALGLQSGTFTRSRSNSPRHAVVPSVTGTSDGSSTVFPRSSYNAVPETAPLREATASSRITAASSLSASAETSAGEEQDPRLPFESPGGAPHIVNLPGGYTPLSEVVTVRFEVTDNGCGLTPEQRGRLFKPYSQVR